VKTVSETKLIEAGAKLHQRYLLPPFIDIETATMSILMPIPTVIVSDDNIITGPRGSAALPIAIGISE
jgi:hypothetical protein